MSDWLDEVLGKSTNPIVLLGLLGQGVFFMRFFVQWLASEKEKRSVIPVAFWYFSIGGGLLLLTYGVLDRDPVILVGQSTGLLIYTRNLYFIYRHRGQDTLEASDTPPSA